MERYLSKQITASVFCDEFYYCYDKELDHSKLTTLESKAFSDLSNVISRFSQYKEDYEIDTKAFSTEKEVISKVIEVQNLLEEGLPISFKEFAECDGKRFVIEENLLKSNAHLSILDNTGFTFDYHDGNVFSCKQFAFEEYGVPIDSWKEKRVIKN
jgi:hypothetical protein